MSSRLDPCEGQPWVNEDAEGRCSSEVGAVARDSCAYIISQRSRPISLVLYYSLASQPPCAHARMICGWGEGSLSAGICADESARSSHMTVPNAA